MHDNSNNKIGRAVQIHIRGDPYRAPYCVKITAQSNYFWQSYPPFLYTAASFKTIPSGYHRGVIASKSTHMSISFKTILILSRPFFYLVYLQRNGRTAHFPAAHIPLALRGPADGLQGVAESHHPHGWKASNIPRERWYASIIGFLGTEGFKRWTHLDISKDMEKRKVPEDVFTAFANTLEVSTSQWNYINEIYSDI